MSPFVGLFFDIIILAALGVTIFYCLRLSRQFNQMRADRKAFETLIQSLNFASARAEASIQSFKEVAVGNGDILQDKINKSRAMAEELEIMIQAGDSLADRLQALAEKSRKAFVDAPNTPETKSEILPRTRAEKELLEAVKAKQQS
jgi:prophage DNA circulation protein